MNNIDVRKLRIGQFWGPKPAAPDAARAGRWLLAAASLALSPAGGAAHAESGRAEIRWDSYGVPHIESTEDNALFYASGWAQMRSHLNLILRFYGTARGKAAEYWGENFIQSDLTVRALGVPQIGESWYGAQEPDFRAHVDAFVQGLNAYADSHLAQIAPENRPVLPLKPVDVFSHLQIILEEGFVGRILDRNPLVPTPASNGIVIGPTRTDGGHAMLLGNPHLSWSGLYTFFEEHLRRGPRNLYGATFVGLPVPVIAFNDSLGWTHTMNKVGGAELYELKLTDADHYLFDGHPTAFERHKLALLVRTNTGVETREYEYRNSIPGLVLSVNGASGLAYRSTRGRSAQLLRQYWLMGNASTLSEFQAAMKLMQLPVFNTLYADDRGNIEYFWGGLVPKHPPSDPVNKPAGKPLLALSSSDLWSDTYKFDQLPSALDPPSGWLQNTNDPPWTCSIPSPISRANYINIVPYSGDPYLRTQITLKKLDAIRSISFADLKALLFYNHVDMADRLVDDLCTALSVYHIPLFKGDDALLQKCLTIFKSWNRNVDATSRGAVLFQAWVEKLGPNLYMEPFDPSRPLDTPRGLRNPSGAVGALLAAAKELQASYGDPGVSWGAVNRLQRGSVDVPASGGPDWLGIFQTIEFSQAGSGRHAAAGGSTFSEVVEFSHPVKAAVLLSYGNSSEPTSPHFGDQLRLLSERQLRPALLDETELAKLTDVEVVNFPLPAAH